MIKSDKENKVLIADDDLFVLNLLEKIITRIGCAPVKARNGEEAIERLMEDTDLKCAVSDICMPRKNGFELLEYILNQTPQIPVILTSSLPFTAGEILHRGARAFLKKPFQIDAMMERISRLIEGEDRQPERRRQSRVPIKLPVTIDSSSTFSVSGWSRDVSRSGINFTISGNNRSLPASFSLRLKLEERRITIEDTRKVWARKEPGGRLSVGCRFGKIDEPSRQLLEKTLAATRPV